MPTMQELRDEAVRLAMTVRKTPFGEYRVNFRGGTEATAYYASDADDALGTMRAMYRERDARDPTWFEREYARALASAGTFGA